LYNTAQNVYAATEPVGQNDGSHFEAAVEVPAGWSLNSTYHTHPSGDRSTEFSENDIDTAQQLKAPSYILPFDDPRVRVFYPSSSRMLRDISSGDLFSTYSYGSLIE
jgi:proteasome lid subunit RPN8/RPN11